MSEVKHTPGPWKYINKPFLNGAPYCTIYSGRDPLSSSNHTGIYLTGCITEDNASLIAAAPDLLCSLKECAAILSANIDGVEFELGEAPLVDRAFAAIAKAEGKSNA